MKNKKEKNLKKKHGFFSKVGFFFHFVFYVFGIAVPISAIVSGKGFLPIHIALIGIATLSFIFYLSSRGVKDRSQKKEIKAKQKKLKKTKGFVKKFSRFYKLLATVYAIYFTSSDPTPLSKLLLVFMVIMFLVDIIFTYIAWSIGKKILSLKKSDADEEVAA